MDDRGEYKSHCQLAEGMVEAFWQAFDSDVLEITEGKRWELARAGVFMFEADSRRKVMPA